MSFWAKALFCNSLQIKIWHQLILQAILIPPVIKPVTCGNVFGELAELNDVFLRKLDAADVFIKADITNGGTLSSFDARDIGTAIEEYGCLLHQYVQTVSCFQGL